MPVYMNEKSERARARSRRTALRRGVFLGLRQGAMPLPPALFLSLALLCLPAAVPAEAPGAAEAPPPALRMVLVEPGFFLMGDDAGGPDQKPAHRVAITRTLLVADRKVTVAEYAAFCAAAGRPKPASRWEDDAAMPAIGVDWRDAVAYCNWLSERDGLKPCYSGSGHAIRCDFNADGYRLPTEAEWEWAARGGRLSKGYSYAGSDDPLAVAWFDENSGGRMHPAGGLAPNELGLFDFSGNLYEWCWDYYSRDAYAEAAPADPSGPAMLPKATPRGPERVRRAGSWRENRESVRISFRARDNENYPGDNGFRLFRTLSPAR